MVNDPDEGAAHRLKHGSPEPTDSPGQTDPPSTSADPASPVDPAIPVEPAGTAAHESVATPDTSVSSVDLESVAQPSDMDRVQPAEPETSEPPAEVTEEHYHHHHHHHDQTHPHPDPIEPEFELEEEEGGGPVKTFLEHLEDLRWMIIRCVAAIAIGMVVCLVAANKIVEALDWPLQKAQLALAEKEQVVLITMATNVLWRFQQSELKNWPVPLGTNRVETYKLLPIPAGSNSFVLELERDTLTRDDAPPKLISLKTYDPIGPFGVALQIALYGGIGLASPFILFFVGQFIIPALRRSEKRFVYQALGVGSVLFVMGVLFCYFVMLRVALNASVVFSHWLTFGADEWRAGEYISFVCKFMLGMGVSFELPVVILTLVKIGLLDYAKLNRFRPYWVVINMIFASLLAPDILSMIIMAIPLQILYEISVFISRFWGLKAPRASR